MAFAALFWQWGSLDGNQAGVGHTTAWLEAGLDLGSNHWAQGTNWNLKDQWVASAGAARATDFAAWTKLFWQQNPNRSWHWEWEFGAGGSGNCVGFARLHFQVGWGQYQFGLDVIDQFSAAGSLGGQRDWNGLDARA